MLRNHFEKYSIAINQSTVHHADLTDSYPPRFRMKRWNYRYASGVRSTTVPS